MSARDESISTSTSLLERARQDDQRAWNRLCQLYSPSIYRWARQCGLQEDDAADVAQEVFSSLARTLPGFRHNDSGSSFRGYLRTITTNKVRDHFRLRSKCPTIQRDEDHSWWGHDAPHDVVDDETTRSELAHRALELMKTDFETQTWTAFIRTAVDGQTAGDVAAELGMSVGAVYVAKSRVLHRLRSELDGLL
ncbi:MAG: RNA polymerase sigma factor [Planctomycetales bacterium]|nr:RNA polymerase sigma factor [Planctomycetales bacterium]